MIYIATHVYFKGRGNESFRWELQIWQDRFRKSNYESHLKYKQEYTVWEGE